MPADFPLFLAPMAGVTNTVFRRICKSRGADIVTSEFVSAEGILQLVGENYPFSNFPMYSSLEEESIYFVVRTGEGETLPYATSFRSRSSFVAKALKAEVRKLEKSGIGRENALSKGGQNVLRYLLERAEPQRREGLSRYGLKLIEVRISIEDSRLVEKEEVVAELAPQ